MISIQLTKEQTEALRNAKTTVALQDSDGQRIAEVEMQEYKLVRQMIEHRHDAEDNYCSDESVELMMRMLNEADTEAGPLPKSEIQRIIARADAEANPTYV